MTKTEQIYFDSMMLKIIHDSRKQFSYYKEGKSRHKYVMIPLEDVLRELNCFRNSIKPPKKRSKNDPKEKA